MKKGKLVIFSAPSGAGKTTLVRHLLAEMDDLDFSISCCTREKRPNEIHGRDYYFISVDEFKRKIENNEFAEWEEVYENNFYGTLFSELDRIWSMGKNVIFDIDVQGGLNLKKQFGEQALAIFVMPPSLEELANRLTERNTESEEKLKMRIKKAEHEMSFATKFDFLLLNDCVDLAKEEATKTVKEFLEN